LGAVESGVDFEKRIVKIYQECRTTEAIQMAFDFLQKEMEPEIEQGIDLTRKKLLENFDEEVHEKLKINLQQSSEYLGKFESWLWQLTKYYLQPFATFNDTENSFFLKKNPFATEDIYKGPYKLGKKNIGEKHKFSTSILESENLYRVGHPLAKKIIAKCKEVKPEIKELVFNLSSADKKISVLQNLIGKQGWMQAKEITISSFEEEDYILFAAFDDEGNILEPEQCQRLFSLEAEALSSISFEEEHSIRFQEIFHSQQISISEENEKRNHSFFDEEVDKLEKWSEDVRESIKYEIKEMGKEIKTRKTEARKLLNLEQKVKEQRVIKDLEKRLAEKRFNQYKNEDEIENRKDGLLDEVEKRLKQQTIEKELFTIRFKIV
jgi:hypothetical protein